MKTEMLRFGPGFRVLFDVGPAQTAEMTIAPGAVEGGASNRHRGAEQWLYVVDGHGEAEVEGRTVPLAPGRLLVIERGERHTVRNTGERLLKTLNFYCPPAFDRDGGPLPAGDDLSEPAGPPVASLR